MRKIEKDEEKIITNIEEKKVEEISEEELDDTIIPIKEREYKGKVVKEVKIDLSKITADTLVKAEKQFMYNGYKFDMSMFTSPFYQLIVASKASGLDLDFILSLGGFEASRICNRVFLFLNHGL